MTYMNRLRNAVGNINKTNQMTEKHWETLITDVFKQA